MSNQKLNHSRTIYTVNSEKKGTIMLIDDHGMELLNEVYKDVCLVTFKAAQHLDIGCFDASYDAMIKLEKILSEREGFVELSNLQRFAAKQLKLI